MKFIVDALYSALSAKYLARQISVMRYFEKFYIISTCQVLLNNKNCFRISVLLEINTEADCTRCS